MVVAGDPAKVIRKATQENEERSTEAKKLYVDLAKKYLEIGSQRTGWTFKYLPLGPISLEMKLCYNYT